MGEENLARQAELALERQGGHDSLFYEGQWHSAGSLAGRAARLATGLIDLGVRPGDRLVVLMANCPEVLITYSAAWRAGAVVTPLIFLVSEDELRNALVDSGAVGVITTPEFLPKVSAAVKGEGRWVGCRGSGSSWSPALGPARARPLRGFRCSTSPRRKRPSRGRSSTGRGPTSPPCCTRAERPGGPRGFRSPTRTCSGAGGPRTRMRSGSTWTPRSCRSPSRTLTGSWSSAAAFTGMKAPGPSSCDGSTRRAG